MNFVLIFSYLEEIIQAGPDAIVLVKDLMRAINDFIAGKITQDEMNTVIADFQKLIGAIPVAASKTTTTVTTTKPA